LGFRSLRSRFDSWQSHFYRDFSGLFYKIY